LEGGEGAQAVPAEETPAPAAPAEQRPPPMTPIVTEQAPTGPTEEYPMPAFARRRLQQVRLALESYVDRSYRPLRPGEFYSSGFLTEERELPFGEMLGGVTPQQIRNLSERTSATLYTTVAVRPPEGASYAVGDTLLVVQMGEEHRGYGLVVLPTGLGKTLIAALVAAELLRERKGTVLLLAPTRPRANCPAGIDLGAAWKRYG